MRARAAASIVAASVLALAACTGTPQASSQGSVEASTPAPSYLQGAVSNGGDQFPGQGGSGPHTPRGQDVAFFDPAQSATLALGALDTLLGKEGYPDAAWFDTGDAVVHHQAATLASFKALKGYGIAVVDAYGDDQVLAVETYCDPLAAVDAIHASYEADLDAGDVEITAVPGSPSCPSALNHDELAWTTKIVASDPNRLVVHFPTDLADPGPVRWAIGVTRKGITDILGQGKLSLLFLSSCKGAMLSGGLATDAVFSYPGCGNLAADVSWLFEAMYGEDGVGHRATDTAYDEIKSRINDGLTYRQFNGPVTLSPAVLETDPAEGRYVKPGTSTDVTVTFDTEMAGAEPAIVSGCGATIDGGQTWNGDGTKLQFKVKVPGNPPDTSLEITIRSETATASSSSGWPNVLSGNSGLDLANGRGPNGNDYVWHMTCVQGLNLTVDGTIQGKNVHGRILGYPAPVLTCEPLTSGGKVVGNIVHWNGYAADSNTSLGGEFDVPYGTWPIGEAIGDQSITIDAVDIHPTEHLGGVNGTIAQNAGDGSISAVATSGADTITVSGSWTCPGASPAP